MLNAPHRRAARIEALTQNVDELQRELDRRLLALEAEVIHLRCIATLARAAVHPNGAAMSVDTAELDALMRAVHDD